MKHSTACSPSAFIYMSPTQSSVTRLPSLKYFKLPSIFAQPLKPSGTKATDGDALDAVAFLATRLMLILKANKRTNAAARYAMTYTFAFISNYSLLNILKLYLANVTILCQIMQLMLNARLQKT